MAGPGTRAVGILLWLAATALGWGQDKPAEHARTCPRGCALRTQALDKALRHLSLLQGNDGDFQAGNAGPIAHTSMAGLAFLAAGHTDKKEIYSGEVAKCRDYLLQEIGGPNMNRVHWDLAFSAIFLAQLNRVEPSSRTREGLRKLVSKIEARAIKAEDGATAGASSHRR